MYRPLGVIPAIAIAVAEKELTQIFAGHSELYKSTQAAIPVLQSAAIAGNTCAYVVLRSLSGDQAYCRAAIDQCHQIGTFVGEPGPCGAADAATKNMARAAWQAVDSQNPSVAAAAAAAIGSAPTGGGYSGPGVASGLNVNVGGIPLWLIGLGALAYVATSGRR